MKVTDYRQMITSARDVARDEAKRNCPDQYVCTRGAWMIVRQGDELLVGDGEIEYRGSLKQLTSLLEKFPQADEISVAGGFDVSETKSDYDSGIYDAWVSEWDIVVWTKSKTTI
jgi:hypothetical protein